MGPRGWPLTVAVLDSHPLSKSFCWPTVLKAEAALIKVNKSVTMWSFVCMRVLEKV